MSPADPVRRDPSLRPSRPVAPPTVRPVMLLTFDVRYDPAAVTFALDTAAEAKAELLVTDGVPLPIGNPAATALRGFGDRHVVESSAELVRAARERGIEARQLLFNSPRPLHATLDVLNEQGVGLLVFGPDRKALGRWLFRRAARRLREQAPCLVWTNE
jgi:hypothetical protein